MRLPPLLQYRFNRVRASNPGIGRIRAGSEEEPDAIPAKSPRDRPSELFRNQDPRHPLVRELIRIHQNRQPQKTEDD